MLHPYIGSVAIFYLSMCFCVVPACVMFGCVLRVGAKDECGKHARRKDKDILQFF